MLSEQSGRQVLFPTAAVEGVRTKAIEGEMTAADALDKMLGGTVLVGIEDGKTGSLTVRREESPSDARKNGPRAAQMAASDRPSQPGATSSRASNVGTGSISGRVFNPATQEFVRNAEVSISGTSHVALSDDQGIYRLTRVPSGEAVVSVKYTGYTASSASVSVVSGETSTHDIELTSALVSGGAAASPDEIYKLTEFIVSGEREGNAKAIMEQRNSMDITNTVASDVFGDTSEGNVGDFLRNLPGVDLELTQGEVRNVRLRGLGSEYNAVMIDGVALASADGLNAQVGREFSFEQVTLSSMDSIEVSKTISADVDANAPAGTINLKTKRAFSRAGRRIAVQANLTAFADEWHFRQTYGPDDARHRKINPGGSFEYSDVFLNRRLGVVFNIAESNLYSENARSTVNYNFVPTAADPRPVVPMTIAFLHSPRLSRRSTVTLTTDFKATNNLILSLGLVYNYFSRYTLQRTVTFNAATGNRATVIGADPLTSFTSSANARVITDPTAVVKLGETNTIMPKFEYRRGDLVFEGRFAGSDSKSWYNPLARKHSVFETGRPQVNGVQFRAERSSPISSDWRISQISGPDFGLGDQYTSPVMMINDGRFARTQIYSGDITATYKTAQILPITWKTGIKQKHEVRDFINDREANRYTYTGPGAGLGAWAQINSPFAFDIDALHARASSTSGRTAFVPNMLAIGKLFQEHPEYFTNTLTADNYYNARVANNRHFEEDISAGFFMATTNVGRAILRAGVRYEETETDALEVNARSAAEVRDAGFRETNGRATTIPGLEYQFFSQPKLHRVGSYGNWFPSASFKYRLTPNLDFQFGYSTTIRRPTISDLAGVWAIDDDNLIVRAPNPRLQPEESENLAARLAYYFEPVGLLGLNVFQNSVDGLHRETRLTAEGFGYEGATDLSNYEFISTIASEGSTMIRGMELEYSQSLSFLPRPFKALNVRASYTRTYSDAITPLMSPHGASAGFDYTLNRFKVYTSYNWRDNTPANLAGTMYNRHRATIDVGGSVRLTSRFSVYFSGRNVRSEPLVTMERGANSPDLAETVEVTGSVWTFGVKAVF